MKGPEIIYSGSSDNLKKRLKEHNRGDATFTRRYLPWRLVYYEAYLSEEDARELSRSLKGMVKGNAELKKRIGRSLKI